MLFLNLAINVYVRQGVRQFGFLPLCASMDLSLVVYHSVFDRGIHLRKAVLFCTEVLSIKRLTMAFRRTKTLSAID